MKRVLIAGATGYLGRYVVKQLKKKGYYIKVLVRNSKKLDALNPFLAPTIGDDVDEVVIGDLTKPDTLKHVCDNVDYVFSSVGITGKGYGMSFDDVDHQGNVNLLREAEHSDVQTFMYVHVYMKDDWKDPGSLIEAKRRFVDVLKKSTINHLIIRPTGYFSDIATFLNMAKKGRAYVLGDGQTKMNPIHGEDVANFCLQSLSQTNQTLDVGGPEIFTYEQIAQLAFDRLDRKEHITHLPVRFINDLSFGLKWFSKHYYGLYRFIVTVMTHQMIAPRYGEHKVKDFFDELIE